MSCVLGIGGENFNVDDFILKSELTVYKIFHKGEPIVPTKPNGRKSTHSGCGITVSKVEFDDFNKQVEDTIQYLKENSQKLKLIKSTKDIDYASLDFGVSYDESKFVQSKYLPNELLCLVADLGISVEISIYQPTD